MSRVGEDECRRRRDGIDDKLGGWREIAVGGKDWVVEWEGRNALMLQRRIPIARKRETR